LKFTDNIYGAYAITILAFALSIFAISKRILTLDPPRRDRFEEIPKRCNLTVVLLFFNLIGFGLRFWIVFAKANNDFIHEFKSLYWGSSTMALLANILAVFGQTRLINCNKTVVRLATIIGLVSVISMIASVEWFIDNFYTSVAANEWKYIIFSNTVIAPIIQAGAVSVGIILWTLKLDELPQDKIISPRWVALSWVVLLFLNLFSFIMFSTNAYQDNVKVSVKIALQPIFGMIVINIWAFFCLKKRTLLFIVNSFLMIILLTLISQVGFIAWYNRPDASIDPEKIKILYDYYIISIAVGILGQIVGLVVGSIQARRKAPARRNTFDPKEFEILVEEYEENEGI